MVYTINLDIKIEADNEEAAVQVVNELLRGREFWVGDVVEDEREIKL